MLSQAFLDEVRERNGLSALISRSIPLKRDGREYKACCPFHNERTPSFYVNDEKGFYHCFGCQAHGDAISWLTDAQGLTFMDAVKELADAAGMEVPAPDPRSQEKAQRAAGLYEVMQAAARWFADQLGGVDGGPARDYLAQRGIDEATRRKFGFGFAPDGRGRLKSALKNFGNDKLVEAGLLIAPEEGKEPYDRFRGRLTFPIRDARGRCIAFSARILGPGEPKYLNSPDTPLFDKGRTLFNIDKAAPASRSAGRVIVVEGQMDVIALDRAGIGEGIAPLGTALTETQLGLLWRLSPSPILCFDGDAAGQKASVRAALRALPHVGPGRSLGFVTMPPGQDPDDLLRAKGRPALEELLEKPQSLVERLWRHESSAEPLATPEQRAGLKRRLLDHVAVIADPDVRDQYRHELLARWRQLVAPTTSRRDPRRHRHVSPATRAIAEQGLSPIISRSVLFGLIRFPDLVPEHAEAIAALQFDDARLSIFRDRLLHAALAGADLAPIMKNDEAKDVLVNAKTLSFSFSCNRGDQDAARRDLARVLDAVPAGRHKRWGET